MEFEQVTIQLNRLQIEQLKILTYLTGSKPSEHVRRALAGYLERELRKIEKKGGEKNADRNTTSS